MLYPGIYTPAEGAAITIQQTLNDVMNDVGAVAKKERNTHQNFQFRGIDAVINAVSPAFRHHGIVVVPRVVSHDYRQVEIGQKRTLSGHVTLVVEYTFTNLDGDSISATVAAESMDSGEKATAKAMSVAYRTALLQVLCLPTDEPDPDSHTYERSPRESAADLMALVESATTTDELRALWKRAGNHADVQAAIMAKHETVSDE